MNVKQSMLHRVEHYLTCRRQLGFGLKIEGAELLRFARYADDHGHLGPLTSELSIAWAKMIPQSSRLYCARRLDIVRRFAKFQLAYEPETQVPPTGYFGSSFRRPPVHIYNEEQIAALLKSATQLGPPQGLRPQTYGTLFGLLASTGLRISEALRLTIHDIDWDQSQMSVRESKFKGSRLLPLHESTLNELRIYDQFRRHYHDTVKSEAFFVTEFGTALKYWRTLMVFLQLRQKLNWECLHPKPRIHDLRHTFAVRCLLRWYQGGENVDNKILALQTYLGHKKITDTYWYLSAIPELMAQGASRFELFAQQKGGIK